MTASRYPFYVTFGSHYQLRQGIGIRFFTANEHMWKDYLIPAGAYVEGLSDLNLPLLITRVFRTLDKSMS